MRRAHPQEPQLEHGPDGRRVHRTGEDPAQLGITPLPWAREHFRRHGRRRHVKQDLGLFEGSGQGTERESTEARSRSVRIGVVTGIPRWTVTWLGGSRCDATNVT